MNKFLKIIRILLEIGLIIILTTILAKLNHDLEVDDIYSLCSMLLMFIILISEWIRRYKGNEQSKKIDKIAYIIVICFVFFTTIYIMKLSADFNT